MSFLKECLARKGCPPAGTLRSALRVLAAGPPERHAATAGTLLSPDVDPDGAAAVKAVQRLLGHASASMTLDVYSGLFDDDLDAVADLLDVGVV